MRSAAFLLCVFLGAVAAPAYPQVSFGFSLGPGVTLGVHLGGYPRLVRVPGYPVYYAPNVEANYFFYDGLYWIFMDDRWYASTWYDGPWHGVPVDEVPLFVLRVPVRYYRHAPAYFHGWRPNAPPRWGEHFGRDWAERHRGWDRWDHRAVPAPAPLPRYQRQYSGNRYPRVEEQRRLEGRNYHYTPRDRYARRHYEAQRPQRQVQPRQQPRERVQPRQESRERVQPRQESRERVQPRRESRERVPPQSRDERRREDRGGRNDDHGSGG